MTFKNLMRFAGAQLMFLAVAAICLDALAYFFLPNSLAWKFPDYRISKNIVSEEGRHYPLNYFQVHPKRGFDISPNAKGVHAFSELSYPIWSNSMGCFDREWVAVPNTYYYFGGDSFTWGYARFEDKFATLFENATGIPSLKCGVTGTGTRHQFEKFKDIAKMIGHFPISVIVSFYSNDIAEDFIHPHKTVVNGHLVVNTFIDLDFSPVRVDSNWIERSLFSALEARDSARTCSQNIKYIAKCYSLVANVLVGLARVEYTTTSRVIKPIFPSILYEGKDLAHVTNIENIYAANDCLDCNSQIFNGPNMSAIFDWKQHADDNKYKLKIMLVPPRYAHGYSDFYRGLVHKLSAMGIETLDLAQEIKRNKLGSHDVYWRWDGHFSPSGNRAAAQALVRRWGS